MILTNFKDSGSDLHVIAAHTTFSEATEYLAERMKGIPYLGMECLGRDVSKIKFQGKNFYYNNSKCALMELRENGGK